MSTMEVLVPSLGGISNSRVIEVLVKAGQTIEVDAPLITLESDKASMEIPSPYAGVVEDMKLKEGDLVNEGDLVLTMQVDKVELEPEAPKSEPQTDKVAPQAVSTSSKDIYAGPFVRRMAFELGIDLATVKATGSGGRVTIEDMKAHLGTRSAPTADYQQWGKVTTKAFTRIQALSAKHLAHVWQTVPQVTQHHEVDITELEALRKRIETIRLTPVAIFMKAMAQMMQEHPAYRSGFMDAQEVCIREYYHIGFACETPEGLVVPVCRDCDTKSIQLIAEDVASLSEKAREGKLEKVDLGGSVATISSLGGIGGGHFTPIVNAPDAWILGVSRAVHLPRYHQDSLVARYILPISLSYDHRLIDGADGARFVVGFAKQLERLSKLTPEELLAYTG